MAKGGGEKRLWIDEGVRGEEGTRESDDGERLRGEERKSSFSER